MEEDIEMPSTKSVGIKYGLIGGLIGIIWFIVMDVTGNATNQTLQWLGVLITIAVVYFAHAEYKRDGDGFMEFGQGVGIGAWIGLVSAGLSAVFTYIYVTLVNTDYVQAIRDKSRMDMEEQGLSDAQVEQAMQMTEAFTGPVALSILGFVMGFIITLIVALIVAAITKKARPELA